MTFKLAFRTIRRNVRDYAIYFVTLVFGVATFFAFNSLSAQGVMFDLLNQADDTIFELTDTMMGLFSVVVACVLGFLVIYANRFLIRRRKRTFGIYLTLGMSPAGVARIVLVETVVVGLVALGLGLAIGIGLAQALTFVTAALLGTTISHYEFIFSTDALFKTLISFGVIFLVVALFNTLAVSRLKLIDLLSAENRNERTPVRNPLLCAIGFAIAIGLLVWAYLTLNANGLKNLDAQFWLATGLMLGGTLLLFWSLAGLTIGLLTRLRGVYLRGLVPFTTRQVASKINTAYLSLWAVAVLLFFSITVFSTGMGLVEVFTGDIEAATPYDVSLRTDYYPTVADNHGVRSSQERRQAMESDTPEMYGEAQAYGYNPLPLLEQRVQNWHELVGDAAVLRVWDVPGLPYSELPTIFEQAGHVLDPSELETLSSHVGNVEIASLSDFNAMQALVGGAPLELASNHYAVLNNMAITDTIAQALLSDNVRLGFAGVVLTPQGPLETLQLTDMPMLSSGLIFIVPDEVVARVEAQGALPVYAYTNVMLRDPGSAGEEAFKRALYDSLKEPAWPAYDASLGGAQVTNGVGYYDESLVSNWPVSNEIFRTYMQAQAGGLRMLITYLALYIGFVLLIATAAILAIQQLSEAADSQGRYRLLGALGCDRPMLSHSLFFQVLLYFAAPRIVAICHSAEAISVLTSTLFNGFGIAVGTPILLSALLVLVVYGAYFLITFATSRALLFRQSAEAPA